MGKKTDKTIDLGEYAVGDEIVVKRGDATLSLKIGETSIIPDFVDVLTKVVMGGPHPLINVCDGWLCRTHGWNTDADIRRRLAEIRDRVWNSVVVPEQSTETETSKKGEK